MLERNKASLLAEGERIVKRDLYHRWANHCDTTHASTILFSVSAYIMNPSFQGILTLFQIS